MRKNQLGTLSASEEIKRYKMWKKKKNWVYGATTLLVALGIASGVQTTTVSAAEAGTAGQPSTEVLEQQRTAAKAAEQAENMGKATQPSEELLAADQTAAKAAEQAENMGKATQPSEELLAADQAAAKESEAAAKAEDAKTYDEFKQEETERLTKNLDAKQGYQDGYHYGETNATLPKTYEGKSDAYVKSFADGYNTGAQIYGQKLEYAKQAAEAEAQQGYQDGYRYGETNATLPKTHEGKTNNYIEAFAKGYNVGVKIYEQKLAYAKAAAAKEANEAFNDGQRYGETGAVLPDLAGKNDNYVEAFADGYNAGSAIRAQKAAAEEEKALAKFQAENMGQATQPSEEQLADLKAEYQETHLGGQATQPSPEQLAAAQTASKAAAHMGQATQPSEEQLAVLKEEYFKLNPVTTTKNGEGVFVTSEDFYDNTDNDQTNNLETTGAKNGEGVFVTAKDFYDNTDDDPTNNLVVTGAKNGEGVFVTAKDFYDNTDEDKTNDRVFDVVETGTTSKKPAVVTIAAKTPTAKKGNKVIAATATKATLPKTGEAENSGMVALGAVILATTTVGVIAMKSRKEVL